MFKTHLKVKPLLLEVIADMSIHMKTMSMYRSAVYKMIRAQNRLESSYIKETVIKNIYSCFFLSIVFIVFIYLRIFSWSFSALDKTTKYSRTPRSFGLS